MPIKLEDLFEQLRKHYWDIKLYNVHQDAIHWLLSVKKKDSMVSDKYEGLILRNVVRRALSDVK